jgi:hypothetical protein
VGIEGGVEDVNQEMAVFAWVVVRSPTLIGKSQTGCFFYRRLLPVWFGRVRSSAKRMTSFSTGAIKAGKWGDWNIDR